MVSKTGSFSYAFAALLIALASVGCGSHAAVPQPPRLDTLRRNAAAHPRDANAARELALAEIFGRGGETPRMGKELDAALALDAKRPELLFAQGLLDDVHGKPGSALDHYLSALDAALEAKNLPERAALIEGLAYAIAGLDGNAAGYVPKVRAALSAALTHGDLPMPARTALGEALLALLQRAGDNAESAKVAAALGCIPQVSVAGPFGPRDLLGFDEKPTRLDPSVALAASYDLGPGRGVRDTRVAHARGCSIHVGAGPIAEGGTTFAQAMLQVPAAGDYFARIDTPNSIEVFVDGKSLARIDRRSHLGVRLAYVKLPLTAGAHRVTAMFGTRHPNPVFELAFLPSVPGDDGAAPLPFSSTLPRDGFPLYLRALLAMMRGDILVARQMLTAPTSMKDASPLLVLQRAGVALGDPLLPDEVKHDDARKFLVQALSRDPELWAPVTQLATLAAKSGRVKESIGALQKARSHWPEVPAIGFALIELLRSKGLEAEVEHEIARLRELVPDACAPLSAELDSLRSRQRAHDAEIAAKALSQCDAQNNALLSLYVSKRDYESAARELKRLSSLGPEEARYSWLLAELALAKNRGDDAGVRAAIAELRARYPRSYSGAIEEIDERLAHAKPSDALAALDAAVKSEPTSMATLHRLVPVLGGEHVLAKYRRDGKATIDAFVKSGRSFDGPQVLVLDYMALRLFPDGSSLQLIHSITKAQSDEAVNQLAEVEVPEGAQVLTLRAWKPDGRRLEADSIAGKDSVSLPSVAPGDFVELEYLQASAPPDGFPNGYLGERFYFESFEIPFDHSEMVVVLPKDLPYEVDPRGPAPKLEEKVDGTLRELRWHVDQSLPLVAEPMSVAGKEYIPSVRLGVRATNPSMIESLRDALIDRDLYDPYYAALARSIVGEAAPGDYRARAERLYAWVLENIENNDDVFSQAALMLRAHTGNRARVLNYLLNLVGVPSQLGLASNFTGDQTPSTMADADKYDHLLLRVDAGKGKPPIWLFTVERWAPFGFLPSVLRGQEALMLTPGAPLVHVSQGLLGDDTRDFQMDIALHPDGSARIDAAETLHGAEAVSWRGQLEQIPAAELERKFEQDYVARLFPGATLVSLEITGREQDRPDLVLRYSVDVTSFGRHVNHGLALPPLVTTDLASTFARTSARKTTELVPGPVLNRMSARIKLPNGATLPVLPDAATLTAAVGAQSGAMAAAASPGSPTRPTFRQTAQWKTGTLTVDRTLTLP
ncbi:MAG TPA: hypothetical protein VHM19_03225, partial [Polyangiales bacterium]|nr:hypothetical protein [Polyangiales bacterium]